MKTEPTTPAPQPESELDRTRAELERLKERHKASLRRADELNNALMAEVQRYAEGTERPELWSVYARMHDRALKAEAERARATRAFDTLMEKHDKSKAERDQLRAALSEVLGIVAAWCIEANNVGGVDAGDLAWRLEQAGYLLPDEEQDNAGAAEGSDR